MTIFTNGKDRHLPVFLLSLIQYAVSDKYSVPILAAFTGITVRATELIG